MSTCVQILGQPVVVENKPGAFGIIAIEEMARSRPDGYTLQIGNPGTNVLTPLVYKKKLKIDYDRDVVMVTRLGEVPLVLSATVKDFPPKTYSEFIAYARANPGKVRYASVGVGSNNHYDMEAFCKWAGIALLHLPNKGGGAAITNDLVTGDAHIALVNAASSGGVIKSGQARALAVMADARLPFSRCPDAQGVRLRLRQGAVVGPVRAWAAPRDVLETVRRAAAQSLGSEPVLAAFARQMIKAVPNASMRMPSLNRIETAYWRKVTDEVKVELPD